MPEGGTWADLGAGGGTFTRALARLIGANGRVIAVDRDPRAVRALAAIGAEPGSARIEAVLGDFHRLNEVDALRDLAIDGALLANALHFSADATAVLEDVARRVRAGGTVVVVEYDRRPASRWVPYPLGFARLAQIAAAIELPQPRLLAERPSNYGGVIYAAALDRRP